MKRQGEKIDPRSKKFATVFLSVFVFLFVLARSLVYIVDPFFHFHRPLPSFSYSLYNERYQNDGILRHFDYDAIITGTSTSGSFKKSSFDELFGKNCVKVCLRGGTPREINEELTRRLRYNSDIDTVLLGIDYDFLLYDPDTLNYDGIPYYLYDDDLLNDWEYLINWRVLKDDVFKVFLDTLGQKKSLDFDAYESWRDTELKTGKAAVLKNYVSPRQVDYEVHLSDDTEAALQERLERNFLSLMRSRPDTQFIVYFTPSSLAVYDNLKKTGQICYVFESIKYAAAEFLKLDNVKVFMFFDDYDVICDFDNFYDGIHYTADINDLILNRICKGEYQITFDNIDDRFSRIISFYRNFDYDRALAF